MNKDETIYKKAEKEIMLSLDGIKKCYNFFEVGIFHSAFNICVLEEECIIDVAIIINGTEFNYRNDIYNNPYSIDKRVLDIRQKAIRAFVEPKFISEAHIGLKTFEIEQEKTLKAISAINKIHFLKDRKSYSRFKNEFDLSLLIKFGDSAIQGIGRASEAAFYNYRGTVVLSKLYVKDVCKLIDCLCMLDDLSNSKIKELNDLYDMIYSV